MLEHGFKKHSGRPPRGAPQGGVLENRTRWPPEKLAPPSAGARLGAYAPGVVVGANGLKLGLNLGYLIV